MKNQDIIDNPNDRHPEASGGIPKCAVCGAEGYDHFVTCNSVQPNVIFCKGCFNKWSETPSRKRGGMITENIKIEREYEIQYSTDEGRAVAVDNAKKGVSHGATWTAGGTFAKTREIGKPREVENDAAQDDKP